MHRDYTYRGITITVTVNTVPGKRFRWSFETSNGLSGKSDMPTSFGVEDAFRQAKEEAERAIDRERE